MPLAAGSYGSVNFIVPEIMDTQYTEESDYAEIPVINGYPRLHRVGFKLNEFVVKLRLDSHPGIGYNVSAKDKLDSLRASVGSATARALTLNGENFGNYLIKSINWSIIATAGTGRPIKIDASVTFLANPV